MVDKGLKGSIDKIILDIYFWRTLINQKTIIHKTSIVHNLTLFPYFPAKLIVEVSQIGMKDDYLLMYSICYSERKDILEYVLHTEKSFTDKLRESYLKHYFVKSNFELVGLLIEPKTIAEASDSSRGVVNRDKKVPLISKGFITENRTHHISAETEEYLTRSLRARVPALQGTLCLRCRHKPCWCRKHRGREIDKDCLKQRMCILIYIRHQKNINNAIILIEIITYCVIYYIIE